MHTTITVVFLILFAPPAFSAGAQSLPDNPCDVLTAAELADITALLIAVPPRAERRSELYWDARSKYFEAFPGSAQHIDGLGMDAWLAGGASLRVLVRENEYVMLSTQIYQRQSRELLVQIARAILRQ